MNSRLAGTTMSKISLEGVLALKRAGLVSTFRTVYSARLQEKIRRSHFLYIAENLQTSMQEEKSLLGTLNLRTVMR